MENKNIPVKPAKKTRGDILHERMVLLGEIKPEKQFDKKKFFLTSVIILAVIIAAIVVIQFRLNVIDYYESVTYGQETEAAVEAATLDEPEVIEATMSEAVSAAGVSKPQDYSFGPFYRAGKLLLIIAACAYAFYAIIR
ncbi:MAG: hypothetical protein IJD86_13270, partial [Clostridia bacterium]|nr:hypothetical protein [Clostridia bacterium]